MMSDVKERDWKHREQVYLGPSPRIHIQMSEVVTPFSVGTMTVITLSIPACFTRIQKEIRSKVHSFYISLKYSSMKLFIIPV